METKKNNSANLEKRKSIFFQIGLIVILTAVFAAFEWRSYYSIKKFEPNEDIAFEPVEYPPIIIEKVKLPEPKSPKVVNTKSTDIRIVKVDPDPIVTDPEPTPDPEPKNPIINLPQPVEDPVDEIIPFHELQDYPEYPGGEKEMFNYLAKTVKYTRSAIEAGVEGKVFLSFIIQKDGSVSDIKVVKGIGFGCDEAVVKAVAAMPKWKAGKQRGKPVAVYFNLPFEFKLR